MIQSIDNFIILRYFSNMRSEYELCTFATVKSNFNFITFLFYNVIILRFC